MQNSACNWAAIKWKFHMLARFS
ncbi:unnamed protein product [Spirodela intermedia]|uniref:Uncharacterized protein n=2 Tax=Spirodela intermedia TaxID=51605 RepID=A0A7I8KJY5_SPIIN|nr:unnamed protein product [Spirodela intermedia]CAA6661697.1 unnamed protein product [Spirodela intermedia]CAA7398070.1 unnamed protein product [Spirodela intermedia]